MRVTDPPVADSPAGRRTWYVRGPRTDAGRSRTIGRGWTHADREPSVAGWTRADREPSVAGGRRPELRHSVLRAIQPRQASPPRNPLHRPNPAILCAEAYRFDANRDRDGSRSGGFVPEA